MSSPHSNDKEISALDQMFGASRSYRSSHKYMELMKFISRFREIAPFNALLLHLQNPDVSYVASTSD